MHGLAVAQANSDVARYQLENQIVPAFDEHPADGVFVTSDRLRLSQEGTTCRRSDGSKELRAIVGRTPPGTLQLATDLLQLATRSFK